MLSEWTERPSHALFFFALSLNALAAQASSISQTTSLGPLDYQV
jgi:hypothetical protein